MGAFPLHGRDGDFWDVDISELVSVHPRERVDPLTRWVMHTLIPMLHRRVAARFRKSCRPATSGIITTYSDDAIVLLTQVLSTCTALLMPLLSVVVLYVVRSDFYRIVVIVLLSILFSGALIFMTDARKIETFAAITAFAAVNIVYLTNGVPDKNA